MKEYKIRDEFIKLGQLLKVCNIAGSGTEAKDIILEGQVKVNGEVETRRGRKMYPGDVAAVSGQEIKVI